jgi:hypothetical protein
MLNEIQTTTTRNRKMPIKTPHTKKERQAVVGQEMHAFKHGTLHSGSKTGPKVTNRKQAIAIGLSEAGLSNRGAKQPHPKTNPGSYDDSAHEPGRSYSAVEKDEGRELEGVKTSVAEHAEIGPDIHRGRIAHTFDRPSAKGSHGFGHGAGQRVGALRMSGHKSAHRIGAK